VLISVQINGLIIDKAPRSDPLGSKSETVLNKRRNIDWKNDVGKSLMPLDRGEIFFQKHRPNVGKLFRRGWTSRHVDRLFGWFWIWMKRDESQISLLEIFKISKSYIDGDGVKVVKKGRVYNKPSKNNKDICLN
jgi:hypothetical protein